MKKIIGIFGLFCLLTSALVVVGCGKSDEGAAPKDATNVSAPDPTKPTSKNNPGTDAPGGSTPASTATATGTK